jgi:hypothetical protein
MILQNNGNVGIRTTTPRQALEVFGGFRFTPDMDACAGPGSNCYGDIYYRTSATNAAGLVINSQTGGTWADINLQTNGASRLTIESGGNVGIGTTDPRATLDVNGDVYIGGQKPIFFQRFYNLGDNVSYNTGIQVTDYECGIAGLGALDGDIQEHDAGKIIVVETHNQNGTWHILADFRTHNNHENWFVTLICVDTNLSYRVGF